MAAVEHSVPLPSTTMVNDDPTVSNPVTSSTTLNVDPTVLTSSTTVNVGPTSSTSVVSSNEMVASTMSNGPTCASTQLDAATVTVTITSTVHATPSQFMTSMVSSSCTVTLTSTVSVTPSTDQRSGQQIDEEDDNSCNAVAICVPVAVVIGVVVCVVVLVVVWRLRQRANYSISTGDPQMAKVYNDMYGSVGCMCTQMYSYIPLS